jgi:hypothetical protein
VRVRVPPSAPIKSMSYSEEEFYRHLSFSSSNHLATTLQGISDDKWDPDRSEAGNRQRARRGYPLLRTLRFVDWRVVLDRRGHRRDPTIEGTAVICVTVNSTETERKRQDTSDRLAELRRRRAKMMRLHGPICPHSSAHEAEAYLKTHNALDE